MTQDLEEGRDKREKLMPATSARAACIFGRGDVKIPGRFYVTEGRWRIFAGEFAPPAYTSRFTANIYFTVGGTTL